MMKAKYLLGALVFPMIFGACTNDIFEQEQPAALPDNSILAGRAKGYVTLNVERVGTETPQTRVNGDINNDEISWLWTGQNDRLGAVVVDYAPGNNIVDSDKDYPKYAITNYPFWPQISEPTASAPFKTNTAVVEGAYIFYSQYDGTLVKKSVISDEVPRIQMVEAGKEAGLKQIGSERKADGEKIGQNFFVSPIMNISLEDGQDTEFPFALTSANSILQIKLKANVAEKYQKNFSISKIVMTALDDDSKFYRKLTLNPAKIADLQAEVKKEKPNLAWMPNNAIDGNSTNTSETVNAVLRKIMSRNDKNEVVSAEKVSYLGPQEEPTSDLVYQLKDKFMFADNNNEFELYVIMPAGEFKGVSGLTEKDGKTQGALKMEVFTNEGVFTTYFGPGEGGSLIAHRGEKININKELKIQEGDSNIDLYDFENKGFNVESSQDWNYAIDYIREHLDRFGSGSAWSTPKLNLIGEEIVVDKDHYFPNCPIIYRGESTLVFEDAENYEINANNVLLNKGTEDYANKVPTLKFTNDAATVSFSNVDKKKDYTETFELVSDAKVVVADKQELTFAQLVSNTAMTIGKKAVVTATTAETNGTLTVDEGANLTVNGAYANGGEVSIEKDAVVTLKNAATNEKDASIVVEVRGKLESTSNFVNNGTLTLLGAGQDMNVNDRSKATFKDLENGGKIDVLTGGTNKGTYGGRLEVSTSVTNYGEINVNGEFVATDATGTNYGQVILLEDPYALIQLGKQFKSIQDGKIVLSTPEQYEMFDNYYKQNNELSEVQGVIEAQMTQKTYDAVMKNMADYSGQENAWEVLNKIIVTGDLELKADMGGLNKNVVLNGANLMATADLELNTLTIVEGTENSLSLATGVKAATIAVTEKEKSNVNVFGDLTINNGVTLKINYHQLSSVDYMLNIGQKGNLVNNGLIDSTDGEGGSTDTWDGVNRLFTYNAGTLTNNGQICKADAPKYSGAAFNQLIQLIKDLKNTEGTKFVGTWDTNKPRVERWDAQDEGWAKDESTWTSSKTPLTLGEDELYELLRNGKIDSYDGFYYIQSKIRDKWFTMYLGLNKNAPTEDFKSLIKELKENEDKLNVAFANAVSGTEVPVLTKTWMYVTNYGLLDFTKGQAYGQFNGVNHGTIKGDFSK
ncbi:hypothetical protein [Bacteroides ndongoniae]|uniref:hypothetical protein n=1 Tax=Bacteroides ndongoniae TaxID=1903262 RepID=UPI0023F93DA4|nr:hypothetical protein [Bacteroides ndongoniae]